MTKEILKTKSKEEVLDFIRARLTVNGERLRFDMSGFDNEDDMGKPIAGSCTIHNMNIINMFADLGIYYYVVYLHLYCWKGSVILYHKLLDHINFEDYGNEEECLSGYSTSEIIYNIFEKTIFSVKK